MGNLIGHVGPGFGFLVLGVLFLLRALGHHKLLRRFREDRFWATCDGTFSIGFGILALVGESTDMIVRQSLAMSHITHIRLISLLIVGGLFTKAHIHNTLKESFWVLVFPVFAVFTGLALGSHHQDTQQGTIMHQVLMPLYVVIGVSYLISHLINIHSNPKHHIDSDIKLRAYYADAANSELSLSKLISFIVEKPVGSTRALPPINPIYSNHAAYHTVFPMLTAVALLFVGVWWCHMGLVLFNGSSPPKMDMMASHKVTGLFLSDLLYVLVCVAVFTMGVGMWDDPRQVALNWHTYALESSSSLSGPDDGGDRRSDRDTDSLTQRSV